MKDHWWKPLAFVLLSIYWFDPFVWIAYVLVCRDIEFACDEKVIYRFNITEKKGYSAALLECSEGKRLVLACPVAFGETAVVQRVRNVLNYKKPRFWLILISAGAILVTAIGFLTVPKKQAAPDFQESKPVQDASSATTPTAPAQSTTVPTSPTEEKNLNDEWADFPDGIHIESYKGETFTAHIMVIRNPANVYLATSTDDFSTETPGIPMDAAMEQENAVAAINASYFNDDGSGSLLCMILFCGASFFGLNELKGWLTRYELAQPSTKASEVFIQLFVAHDWGTLYDLAQDSSYGSRDAFVNSMEDTVGNSELTLMETSTGLSGDKKYLIRLEKEKIAEFTLVNQSQGTAQTDIPDWELGKVTFFLKQEEISYRIQKLDGHTAYD